MSSIDRRARGLGRTQKLVLQLLASAGSSSARDLEYHWPSLTEASARTAITGLARRGLVDASGWNVRGGRTYCLTERGASVERALNE
jgi:hypothetical protein